MILSIWKKSEQDRNCLVKIDNSVWGTISEKSLRTLFHYHPGSIDITESEATFLKDELIRIAWNKLLDWLSKQEHSTFECRNYLKRFQFHQSTIDLCISEALKKQYVDDERYCRLLIESLQNRQKSRIQIKSKLIEKRLLESLWEPILREMDNPATNHSIIMIQAEKAYQRFAALDKKTCYEKCLTALYRKGFDLEEAGDALRELFSRKI